MTTTTSPTAAQAEAEARAAADAAARQSGHAIRFELAYGPHPSLTAARYRLDNGLGILLLPDHRAPVFAYQTWFKVGSADEDPERTGLAHLFEHLMFKGTERYPHGVLDRELERRGSQTNAATWVDWTYYHEALAARADNLATVIAMESDRMTGLVLEPEMLKSEIEVVKNERRMSVDDSVSGTLAEQLYGQAFTRHSYRWPTIGSMAHLDAASLADLRDFYAAYYAPNNATVVVAGDVDAVDTLVLLARAYGPLSRQPLRRRSRTPEPAQSSERRASVTRALLAPQLLIGYHSPPQLHPDHTALELLTDALAVGDGARLYRRLVIDEHLASEVGAYPSPFVDPGLFQIAVTARPDADPERIVRVVQEELDLLQKGLSEREGKKARHNHEYAHFEGLRDAESCADALGHFETTAGDFTHAFRGLERIAAVRDPDLVRVAAAVLRPENRTVVVAGPAGSPSGSAPRASH